MTQHPQAAGRGKRRERRVWRSGPCVVAKDVSGEKAEGCRHRNLGRVGGASLLVQVQHPATQPEAGATRWWLARLSGASQVDNGSAIIIITHQAIHANMANSPERGKGTVRRAVRRTCGCQASHIVMVCCKIGNPWTADSI
jgi:hypothetical protein